MTAARILVVDDEVDISTILTVTLRRAGYEVASAADGIEAIEAIKRQAPDLVLLDVMMPRADGLETLKRIREHPPTAQVPVIMLTARSRLTDKMKGFERGADDYVAKPFEPAEILARVAAGQTHSVTAADIFNAATVGGARALGRDDLGRITPGAKADLVMVDIAHPSMQPLYDPVRSLIYAAGERAIKHVFVGGQPVVGDGRALAF